MVSNHLPTVRFSIRAWRRQACRLAYGSTTPGRYHRVDHRPRPVRAAADGRQQGVIADGLDMHRNKVIKYSEGLKAENSPEESRIAGKFYYKAVKEPPG